MLDMVGRSPSSTVEPRTELSLSLSSLLPFTLPVTENKRRWMMVNDTQTAGLVARCSVSPAHLASCERSSCSTDCTSRETQTRNVTVVHTWYLSVSTRISGGLAAFNLLRQSVNSLLCSFRRGEASVKPRLKS